MGKALALIEPQIDIIVTSPLARAQQTGELLGEKVSDHPILRVTDNLAPGFSQSKLFKELMDLSGGANLVAVGHQPDMSMLISYLMTDSVHAAIELTPCAVAKLKILGTVTKPNARLSWILTSDVVKCLYPLILGE